MEFQKQLYKNLRLVLLLKSIFDGNLHVQVQNNENVQAARNIREGLRNGMFYHYALTLLSENLGNIMHNYRLDKKGADYLSFVRYELNRAGVQMTADGMFTREFGGSQINTDYSELKNVISPFLNYMTDTYNYNLCKNIVKIYDELFLVEAAFQRGVLLVHHVSGDYLGQYRDRFKYDIDKVAMHTAGVIFSNCLRVFSDMIANRNMAALIGKAEESEVAKSFLISIRDRIEYISDIIRVFYSQENGEKVSDEQLGLYSTIINFCTFYDIPDDELLDHIEKFISVNEKYLTPDGDIIETDENDSNNDDANTNRVKNYGVTDDMTDGAD